jgi:hypothetical protein
MEVLELLAQRRAQNRLESARKKQQTAKTLSNQQQFAGAVIGLQR